MQPLQYYLNPAAKDKSITHAAAAPSNLDAAISMRSADTELQNTKELRATASEIAAPKPDISTPKRKKDNFEALFKRDFEKENYEIQLQKTIVTQPRQCDLQPQSQETQRTTHTERTTRCRTQRRNRFADETTAAATAAHRRYLSSPAATTLHGKTQSSVLPLPPQHKPHATFMQPLQCIVQHHVAHLHLSTHMATPDDNNHAAIPIRSAATDARNAENYAHRNKHSLQNTEEEPIRG